MSDAEFVCVWFETAKTWIAFSAQGMITRCHGSVGSCVNAVLMTWGAAEADYDCTEDRGTFYRYIRADANYDRKVCQYCGRQGPFHYGCCRMRKTDIPVDKQAATRQDCER